MTAKILELNLSASHFSTAAKRVKGKVTAENGAMPDRGTNTVRRPTRGIILKEDTFATIRVVASDGRPITLVDAGSRRKRSDGQYFEINGKRATDVYSNFLLQAIQEDRQEKQQILETFGEPYIFLFGQRARVMNFQGILANTWDFNWEAEWWWNYENYLRGTKCVEHDAQVFISFDNTIVGGYIIQTTATKSTNDRNFVGFQFAMFVTSYASLIRPGDPAGTKYTQEMIAQAGGLNALTGAAPGKASMITLTAQANPAQLITGSKLNPELSLESELGLHTSPNSIKNAWLAATTRVQKVLNTVNGIYSGAPVRVPVGFEGSFAYDDEIAASQTVIEESNTKSGVVRYGTFAQNDDEYVGIGDQYATSSMDLGALSYQTKAQKLLEGVGFQSRAKQLLAAAGYVIPTDVIDKLATAARVLRLGVIAATTIKNLATYRPPDVTSLVGGTAVQDTTYGAGATVDPAARFNNVYKG